MLFYWWDEEEAGYGAITKGLESERIGRLVWDWLVRMLWVGSRLRATRAGDWREGGYGAMDKLESSIRVCYEITIVLLDGNNWLSFFSFVFLVLTTLASSQ